MAFLAALATTTTLAVQEVTAVVYQPSGSHHHRKHHRRHRRRRPDAPLYETVIASWYSYPASAPGACGHMVANGVAHKTLPCGTRLVMCAARCASAVVDDRGPYIAGRTFDLSATLAQRVGFSLGAGVGPVRWRPERPRLLWRLAAS